jgi:hypothetical protein
MMPAVPQTSNLGLQLPPPDVYDSPAPNWGAILNAELSEARLAGERHPHVEAQHQRGPELQRVQRDEL